MNVVRIEISGVTPHVLTKMAVAHRKARAAKDAPTDLAAHHGDDMLHVTNDGASGKFKVKTMALTLDGAEAVLEAAGDAAAQESFLAEQARREAEGGTSFAAPEVFSGD